MKRSELRRKTRLQAKGRLARRTRMKGTNPARRASEFARCYGSKARVAFVKGLPCAWCGRTPCDNAHLRTDGMGRKAGYTTIVPLCSGPDGCHRRYDERQGEYRDADMRELLALHAPRIEQLWQDHLTRSGRTAA